MKFSFHGTPERPLSKSSLDIFPSSFSRVLSLLSVLILAGSFGGMMRVFATTPASVNFGNVTVGTTSKKTVTITNSGSFDWTLTAVTVAGTGFKVSGLSLPLTIRPGLSTSFTISFTPTTIGTFFGYTTLTWHQIGSSVISLSGTGVTRLLRLSPTSLKFGNTVIRDNTILSVIVTNIGTAAVTISRAGVTGAGFSCGHFNLPLTLSAGQSTSFSVTFDPSSTGTSTGLVSLTSNATNSPSILALSGAGVLASSVSLRWTPSTSTGVTGYNVYRLVLGGLLSCPANLAYVKLNTSLISQTSYTDSTVVSNQTYCYAATAVRPTEESKYSTPVFVKVP